MSDDKKNNSPMKGFEGVLDLIPGSKRAKSKDGHSSKLNEDFSLQNLLDLEIHRLEKIDMFLEKKMSLHKKFNQLEKLIEKQDRENETMRDKIILESRQDYSSLFRNMSRLYNATFFSAHQADQEE